MNVIDNLKEIPPVEEGSTWEWLYDVTCRSGGVQRKGTIALVVERTGMIPHGEVMSRGYNLLIHTGGSTSVWATFEQCVSRGLLKPAGVGT